VSTKVLFITDPLDALDYPRDTTVSLIKEFYKNGSEVQHLDFSNINEIEKLPTQRLVGCSDSKTQPFRWEKLQKQSAHNFNFIFHRKDPPVDEAYKKTCLQFENLPKKIIQINNPALISSIPEKLLPLDFPEYCIPTQIVSSFEELQKTIRKLQTEIVVKPINLFSGYGIEFFSSKTSDLDLENYYKKYGPELVLQEYVPEAETQGDLRVLMFNGLVLGAFMRRAAPGKRLQNLHQGGSIHRWELNPLQKKATSEIGNALAKRGLYFLGVDFLGDKISEINITSPMGTVQIDELYDTHCESLVLAQCLELLKKGGLAK